MTGDELDEGLDPWGCLLGLAASVAAVAVIVVSVVILAHLFGWTDVTS